MASVNKVTLVGNVGRDAPKQRSFQNGGKVAEFGLATNKRIVNRTTNERSDKTTWHRIKIFNDRLIDTVVPYIKPGTQLYLEGEIVYEEWSGNDGVKHKDAVVEIRLNGQIELLSGREDDAHAGAGAGAQAQQPAAQQQQTAAAPAAQPPAAPAPGPAPAPGAAPAGAPNGGWGQTWGGAPGPANGASPWPA